MLFRSEMYKLAYAWAPDVQVLWLRSSGTAKDGTVPLWTAMFVSANKKSAHEFTYRAITEDTKRKGVVSGTEQAWGGPTPKGQPFATADMRKRLSADGADPAGGTPADLAAHHKADFERWQKVIRDAGIKGE